jgi:hypothetical protein
MSRDVDKMVRDHEERLRFIEVVGDEVLKIFVAHGLTVSGARWVLSKLEKEIADQADAVKVTCSEEDSQ